MTAIVIAELTTEQATQGQHIGYVRVSTTDQNTERQLADVPLAKTFTDKASGGTTDRPGLGDCLDYLREGDTLHVHSIDRLARSLVDLEKIVADLNSRGVAVQFHKEGLAFEPGNGSDPMKTLLRQVMAAFAQFERSLIRERQREGIARAKEKGIYKGRSRALKPEQVAEARDRINAGEKVAAVARSLGVSRQTLHASLNR